MPATMTPEEAAEAPALSATPTPAPTLSNPVINDTGIKGMAQKFRELMKPETPRAAEPNPMPSLRQDPPKAPGELQKLPVEAPKSAEGVKPSAEPDLPPLDERTLSTPARSHFKRLEQSKDEYKRQVEEGRKVLENLTSKQKELETEVNKFKALGVDPDAFQKTKEDREKLAKENEAMLAQLETVNLERSPRFQNWWKAETDKHLRLAQRLVPVEHREKVAKLLMEEPSEARNAALDEIIEPLPNTSKRIVTGALEALESVKMQREEALTKGSERYRELQSHEQAERAKEQTDKQRRLEQITAAALLKAEQFSAFQQDPNDAAHTSEIPSRKGFIQAAIRGQLDEDVAISMPALAIEALHLQNKVIPGLKAEIAKRDEIIKQLQGSAPRTSEGHGSAQKIPGTERAVNVKPGEGFAAKVREAMGRS